MPNWCSNTLCIQFGNKSELKKIKKLLLNKENVVDFALAAPQPENLYQGGLSLQKEKELKEQGIPDWYNWNINNWGTKWNASGCYIVEKDDEEIRVCFDTAWSPPEKWFYAFCDKLKDISRGITAQLRYEESGMWFAGTYVLESDGYIYQHEGEMINISDTTRKEIKYDSKMDVWRDTNGKFVSWADVTYEVDYGY